jgi:hypothetical protein
MIKSSEPNLAGDLPRVWLFVILSYTLRGEKLRFACHSERSEESLFPAAPAQKFLTPLRSVQNDTSEAVHTEKRSLCPRAVYCVTRTVARTNPQQWTPVIEEKGATDNATRTRPWGMARRRSCQPH